MTEVRVVVQVLQWLESVTVMLIGKRVFGKSGSQTFVNPVCAFKHGGRLYHKLFWQILGIYARGLVV